MYVSLCNGNSRADSNLEMWIWLQSDTGCNLFSGKFGRWHMKLWREIADLTSWILVCALSARCFMKTGITVLNSENLPGTHGNCSGKTLDSKSVKVFVGSLSLYALYVLRTRTPNSWSAMHKKVRYGYKIAFHWLKIKQTVWFAMTTSGYKINCFPNAFWVC